MNYLFNLLNECLTIQYSQVGLSANYATKQEGNTLKIYFESSKGREDWKSNFNFPAKPYKRMNKTLWFAHRGFLKVWKEIEPVLEDKIKDANVKKIVIVGYSHGGAIALLCHEYVWFNRPDLRSNLEGYGFGCPRVIWCLRTPSIKKRWKNFVVVRNINDIVTHLPPAILGFTHVGKLLKVGKCGKYSMIDAHKPQNYLTELKDK